MGLQRNDRARSRRDCDTAIPTSLLPTGCPGGLLGLGLEEDQLGGLDRKNGSVKAGVGGCGGEQPRRWHLCEWDIFKGDCDPTRLGSKAPRAG